MSIPKTVEKTDTGKDLKKNTLIKICEHTALLMVLINLKPLTKLTLFFSLNVL